MPGYTYIMTNKPNGTLYIGVTNDLARRVHEHQQGQVKGFTQQYNLKQLVYYESFEDIQHAIKREKTMKKWPRLDKLKAIKNKNPRWRDLSQDLNNIL